MADQLSLFPSRPSRVPGAAQREPARRAEIEFFDDWTELTWAAPPDPNSEISVWFDAPERRWNREDWG